MMGIWVIKVDIGMRLWLSQQFIVIYQMSRPHFFQAFQSITNSTENTFQAPLLQPIKEDFTIDINTSKDFERDYFTQFKSLAEDNIFGIVEQLHGLPPQPQVIQKQVVKQSAIERISRVKQPAQLILRFHSNIQTNETEYQKLITNPSYYSLYENNQSMKQNLQRISKDLGKDLRLYFKGGTINSDAKSVLNLKDIGFQDYSKAIGQLYSNHLFESIVEVYGRLDIEDEIAIPERYEVREKKPLATVGTEVQNDYVSHQEQNSKFTKIALMKMEIRKIKFREERNSQYFSQMEEKLVVFFNYILEDDPKLRVMETFEKIKLVLSDLNRFKNQKCEGESKVTLLLFFFKEFQILKEEKMKIKRQKDAAKVAEEEMTRRQYSHTPVRQRPRKGETTKTEMKIKIDDEEGYWLGSKGNREA